jgi:hypothetical protein
MKEMFAKSENISFCKNVVTIKSALDEKSSSMLEALAEELVGG